MRRLAAVLLFAFVCHAWAAAPGLSFQEKSLDAAGLRSIAGWLRLHGADGFVGADVADAMGIPRPPSEDLLETKQRGYRNAQTLRVAQLLPGSGLMLFMVQAGDGQVFFYLSTVQDGLRKAFVSLPQQNVVAPLDALEAEASFRREVLYWEDKATAR
jgi:hypothetical protein